MLTAATVFATTACSNPSTSSAGTPSKMDAASAASAEDLKPVTLTYWLAGSGEQKDSKEVWAKCNEELAKVLPNTTVEFVSITFSEYKDKWLKACAAQEAIDLAWAGYTHSLSDDVNKGALMPLDDLLASCGADVQSYFGTDVLNMHRSSDGKLYFIPAWQGLVGGRYAFYFPTELVKVVGDDAWADKLQQALFDAEEKYDNPTARSKAYDLVEQYLEANKKNGTLALGYNPESGFDWCQGTGKIRNDGAFAYIEKTDNTFTAKNCFASDMMKYHYGKMADWYKKGYIRSDVDSAEIKETNYEADGIKGYITFAHNGIEDNSAELFSKNYGLELTRALTNKNLYFSTGFATGTVIPATAKNPERAMMLTNLLYTEKGKDFYQTYVYGIKGKHYDDNGDGTIKLLGDQENKAYGQRTWTQGTCEFSLPTNETQIGQYTKMKEAEKNAVADPWAGFSFDTAPIDTVANGLKTVVEEYKDSLRYGSLGDGWEARYEEFLKRLNDAQIDVYVAEYQKQAREYAQKNNIK